jgi:uncharacterized delta-60 repeat protein
MSAVMTRCITALAAGLLSPLGWSAPGDLDTGFGSQGRLRLLDFDGSVRALTPLDGDEFLFGGGDYVRNCVSPCAEDPQYEYVVIGFTGRVSAAAQTDPIAPMVMLDNIEVMDLARQPDGRIIGVGRSVLDGQSQMAVFRLDPDGAPDATFGESGVVLHRATEHGQYATSVALDPDGRIVVAGYRGFNAIVMALDTSGAVDQAFGDGGVYVAANQLELPAMRAPRILRTAQGAYRVIHNDEADTDPFSRPRGHCFLRGVTSSGVAEAGFGDGGSVGIAAESMHAACSSIAELPDGRLLVAGTAGGRAFVHRLLTTGASDVEFTGDAVADVMSTVTAMAVAPDGSIVLAGHKNGTNGAPIVRLLPTGELDPDFGRGGTAWLDLRREFGSSAAIHDLEVSADGGIWLAGKDDDGWLGVRLRDFQEPHPLVARLLGAGPGTSPGVVGLERSFPERAVIETDGEIDFVVRRMGGSSGAVSVAYATSPRTASPGMDYEAVEGVLQWADGDASDKVITIPIVIDTEDEAVEEFYEKFELHLLEAQGASLGSSGAVVLIEDGHPGGLLSMKIAQGPHAEGSTVEITIHRKKFAAGAVSVTLLATAETATADDFASGSTVVSWPDGDSTPRTVSINVTQDSEHEPDEYFSVYLTDPTGGAAVPDNNGFGITITDDDPLDSGGGGGGGGGASGSLELLLLLFSLARVARARRRGGGFGDASLRH